MKQAIYLVIILIVNIALNAFSLQYDHCGERLIKKRGLMVGGKTSQRGMWPWQVGIYKKQVSGWQFLCGGALVSRQWVLTAAHCFYVERNNAIKKWYEQDITDFTKYKIKVGDYDLRSYESSEQEHQFQEIIVHPDYRHDPMYENDIALVKLNHEVILGPYVRTVCLPGPDLDLAKPGTVGMVAGWGKTELGYGSFFLRYSSFTIETNNACEIRAADVYYNKTVAFCASDVKGTSTPCYGDSGGSMVRKLSLNGKHDRFVTIGLVSWSGCSPGHHSSYAYYTRLQPFLPWIYHKVNSTCMGPGKPRNGVVTPVKRVYQPNEVIRFTCDIKYTRIGKSDLTCQRDGTWNGYWPLCSAPCPRPTQPKNGIQLGNNFAHGHSVRFICSPRYRRIGSSVIACLNGKWTNKTPKCAAPCPDPGTPIYGYRYNHSFLHGDQVMFSCEKGKTLIGSKIITCNDGRWDQTTPTCSAECKVDLDAAFLIDSSGSISRRNWKRLLNFVSALISKLNVGPQKTHIAALRYSTRVKIDLHFNTLKGNQITAAEYAKRIKALRWLRGYTYIGKALLVAAQEMFVPNRGMRANVKKVAFVITDGKQTRVVRGRPVKYTRLRVVSQQLKNKGVRVYSIGIGKPGQVSDQELKDVASKPQYIYKPVSFRALVPKIDGIVRSLCED